tara:strand:+ start:743 stop:1945 length:1203 start_codon:yes stop_codon:yes gene_type:complete
MSEIRNMGSQTKRLFSLGILIFSGLGMRILQFNGSLLVYLFILLVLNFKNIKKIPKRWANIYIFLASSYSIIFLLKGVLIPWYVPASMMIALVCLSNYYNKPPEVFRNDFSKLLKIFMYFHLLGVLLIPLNYFFTSITLGYSEYKTFLGLFWYNTQGGPSFYNGLRFTGIVWEVGIWQFFLNANLIFAFYFKKNIKYIVLSILAVITAFSTTGLILLGIVLLYSLILTNKLKFTHFLFILLIGIFTFPFLKDNITDKFTGKNAGSGLTRIADIYSGILLIKNNPFLGSDVDNATASDNYEAYKIKKDLWNGNFTDGAFDGYITVKNSNGIMRFIIDWGLPFSLFLIFKALSSNLFGDKKLMFFFFLMLLISMFSEAISRTGFFYFFILSGLIFKKKIIYK